MTEEKVCPACLTSYYAGERFCSRDGSKLTAVVSGAELLKMVPQGYQNPVGVWKVTTEGDVEGRTIQDLGIHRGHIADIATKLAKSVFYSLRFDAVEPDQLSEDTNTETVDVSISFGIDSRTWDMSVENRQKFVAELMKDRTNVEVRKGQNFASVKLRIVK